MIMTTSEWHSDSYWAKKNGRAQGLDDDEQWEREMNASFEEHFHLIFSFRWHFRRWPPMAAVTPIAIFRASDAIVCTQCAPPTTHKKDWKTQSVCVTLTTRSDNNCSSVFCFIPILIPHLLVTKLFGWFVSRFFFFISSQIFLRKLQIMMFLRHSQRIRWMFRTIKILYFVRLMCRDKYLKEKSQCRMDGKIYRNSNFLNTEYSVTLHGWTASHGNGIVYYSLLSLFLFLVWFERIDKVL